MADDGRYDNLQELNRRLEEMILKRTQELSEKSQELEQQNQELAEANIKIREADQRKSAFLANISHELRTPMNSILGYTNMLLKGSYGYLNELQLKNLKKVYDNAEHLMHILNDILDLSHLELGKIELHIAPVSVKKIVLSSLVSVESLLIDRMLEMEHEIPTDLPAVYVDEVRVREVLINLLSNAIKFTPDHGRITIRAIFPAGTEESGGKKMVELQVKDTGIGIRSEDHEVIFDQFCQLREHLKPDERSAGLGLFISKKLVDIHGGSIQVKSEPGVGSTFSFTMHAADEEREHPVEDHAQGTA
jgi:signal transduction histidine kinase